MLNKHVSFKVTNIGANLLNLRVSPLIELHSMILFKLQDLTSEYNSLTDLQSGAYNARPRCRVNGYFQQIIRILVLCISFLVLGLEWWGHL